MGRPVVEALLPLLEDADTATRSSAATSLARASIADPTMFRQVLERIAPLLIEKKLKSSTIYDLARSIEEEAEYARDVAALATPLLEDPADEVSGYAAMSLGLLSPSVPEVATEQAMAVLLSWTERQLERQNSSPDFAPLTKLLGANPKLAPQVLTALRRWTTESINYSLLYFLSDATSPSMFQTLVAADPDLFDEALVTDLLQVRESFGPVELRYGLLALIGEAKPDMAPKILDGLLEAMKEGDSYNRTHVLGAIATLVRTNQHLVTEELVAELRAGMNNPYISTETVYEGLAAYYAYRYARPEQWDTLFRRLTDPLVPAERPLAERAMFLIALDDQAHIAQIRERLAPLAAGEAPIARVWANKALQLLDIAEFAHKTAATSGEAHKEQLQQLKNYPGLYSFDSGLFWAAWWAVGWVREQTPAVSGS